MNKRTSLPRRKVIYPYYQFTAVCDVATLLGKKHVELTCLVDGINNVAATADKIEAQESTSDYDSVLAPTIGAAAALRTARRYMFHHLCRQSRSLMRFNTRIEPRGIYYRTFWIDDDGRQQVLVDAATGGVYPLDRRCA